MDEFTSSLGHTPRLTADPSQDLKKMVRKMAANGEIKHDNGRKYRRYYC
jgi:hypothetical protein